MDEDGWWEFSSGKQVTANIEFSESGPSEFTQGKNTVPATYRINEKVTVLTLTLKNSTKAKKMRIENIEITNDRMIQGDMIQRDGRNKTPITLLK